MDGLAVVIGLGALCVLIIALVVIVVAWCLVRVNASEEITDAELDAAISRILDTISKTNKE